MAESLFSEIDLTAFKTHSIRGALLRVADGVVETMDTTSVGASGAAFSNVESTGVVAVLRGSPVPQQGSGVLGFPVGENPVGSSGVLKGLERAPETDLRGVQRFQWC